MRKASIVKTLTNGAVSLDVLKYGDGRYGFDWQTDKYTRKQIRKRTLPSAIAEAEKKIKLLVTGKLDLSKISTERYLEFLKWESEQRQSVPVPDVVKSFLKSKETKGLAHKTITGLESNLNAFAKAFTGPIDKLRAEGVEAWLDGRRKRDGKPIGDRRWNNLLDDILALHIYARRNRILGPDKTPVESIEPRKLSYAVQTYTPDELSKLLLNVRNDWLPVIVLGAFCGIRPEELYPEKPKKKRNAAPKPGLRWENILWDKGRIDVPAAVSKTRDRRPVALYDPVALWLAPWRHAKGPVAHSARFWGYLPTLKAKSGVDWRPDALRHSFASYRLAIKPDVPALAFEMGNSPAMIKRHYLDLKHEDEAREWFGLTPEKVGRKMLPDNVVQIA